MSYFFSGIGTDYKKIKGMNDSFIEIVPNIIKNTQKRIEGRNSLFLSYGNEKAINDIEICHKTNGSWLVILGTPLLKTSKDEDDHLFLDRFFQDPISTVKNRIDGSFAILAYNSADHFFYAATDYNNTVPIFFTLKENSLFLSSHELPLARFFQAEIDPLGFSLTTYLKYTWGSHTRFSNLQKLLPCQMMTFSNTDKISLKNYWKPSDENPWPSRFDDVLQRWHSLLEDAVQSFHNHSNNKTFICDFTAGEDSRLLLAQCHALSIPFFAMVDGHENNMDVKVAKEASQRTGFDLIIRPKYSITEKQLFDNATYISIISDSYDDFFTGCAAYATNNANPLKNWEYVKLCGAPGGEAFRGSYYLRGKALFPSSMKNFDYRFFTKMKYLLDYYPGLLRFSDTIFKDTVFHLVEQALVDVNDFPNGIKIDHLLRTFQTCNAGLQFKYPRYIPLASKDLTRSIYNIPPQFKKGGKLTKALTEILFPELAFIKTQKGVPTVRKTFKRSLLFLPEYISTIKLITNGATSRLFRWTESNKPAYNMTPNSHIINSLLNTPPYSDWFSSSKSMMTGYLYNEDIINPLLADAKNGLCKYLPTLANILSQELCLRWVYKEN